MQALLYKLHTNGIQTDMLGQPLYVGDTVLCKGYGSSDKNTFATVVKVNKKTISVMLEKTSITYGRYYPRPAGHSGPWNYYPDYARTVETVPYKRAGFDTLKIPKDFMQIAEARLEEVVNQHPEIML